MIICNTAEGRRVTTERTAEGLNRAQERPEERDIRAGAEDAECRSGSDAKQGERLFRESEYNGDVSH